jgi:hypothetical protein
VEALHAPIRRGTQNLSPAHDAVLRFQGMPLTAVPAAAAGCCPPHRQECSSKLLKLDWLKGKSPLPGGETGYTGGALGDGGLLMVLLLIMRNENVLILQTSNCQAYSK